MNMRKITSLTALLTFALLMITSIILYIVPAGRVAYWSNWKLWSLSKEQWGAVHINLGFLLLVSIVLHIFYNWKPIVSYMKTTNKQLRILTVNFNIALVVTLVVFFGTVGGLPPMSSLINLGDAISDDANLFYGEPPYGHAELSPFSDFAYKVKADVEESLKTLKAAGIVVESQAQTIKDIGEANNVPPKKIYELIKPQSSATSKNLAMPEEAPGGTGKRTLAKICEMYRLDSGSIIKGLELKKIHATSDQTMKEIAAANSLDPHSVYAKIYEVAQK